MLRGGSWNNDASNCRSANRNRNDADNRNNNNGLRLASTIAVRNRQLSHPLISGGPTSLPKTDRLPPPVSPGSAVTHRGGSPGWTMTFEC